MKQYTRFVLIAVDQLLNAVLGGYADETLSSRIWRNASKPKPRRRWVLALKVVNGLFFWQGNHCREAYEMEQMRRHLPGEFADDAAA